MFYNYMINNEEMIKIHHTLLIHYSGVIALIKNNWNVNVREYLLEESKSRNSMIDNKSLFKLKQDKEFKLMNNMYSVLQNGNSKKQNTLFQFINDQIKCTFKKNETIVDLNNYCLQLTPTVLDYHTGKVLVKGLAISLI